MPTPESKVHPQLPGGHDAEQPVVARPRLVIATVVVGSALIGATLRLPRGGAGFYAAGFALAAVWVIGSIAYGRPQWYGHMGPATELGIGVAMGGLTFAMFLGGESVGRRISVLAGPIESVLGKADAGPVAAVLVLALVNGVAEELFFRGALVDAIGRRHAMVLSTLVYVGVTAVAGNTALTLAAVVMGAVFVVERHITGGLAAPIVTHLVWSTLIILFLPR